MMAPKWWDDLHGLINPQVPYNESRSVVWERVRVVDLPPTIWDDCMVAVVGDCMGYMKFLYERHHPQYEEQNAQCFKRIVDICMHSRSIEKVHLSYQDNHPLFPIGIVMGWESFEDMREGFVDLVRSLSSFEVIKSSEWFRQLDLLVLTILQQELSTSDNTVH